jgi:hypothetical protein
MKSDLGSRHNFLAERCASGSDGSRLSDESRNHRATPVHVLGEAKPLRHKLAASAFWFATIGPSVKTIDSDAMTKVLNVRLAFPFTDILSPSTIALYVI